MSHDVLGTLLAVLAHEVEIYCIADIWWRRADSDGMERCKYVEASRTRMSRSLDQHAKPYRAPARTFHCPMVRT